MRFVQYRGRWEYPDGFGRPERIGFVFFGDQPSVISAWKRRMK